MVCVERRRLRQGQHDRALADEGARRGWNLVAALAVAKLDRLSRSLLDFAGLVARAQREGWALIALDLALDMTTPAGGLVANVMASVAEWERKVIGQRTKDALAVKRAQGVRLGRPPTMCPQAVAFIGELRAEGRSYRAIASELDKRGIPTAQGGRMWHAQTVRLVAHRSSPV